jgi:hypothetical protein
LVEQVRGGDPDLARHLRIEERGAALDGALKNGALALKLIREVDPPVEVSVQARMPTTREEVEALSLDELRALVAQFGDEPAGELTPS